MATKICKDSLRTEKHIHWFTANAKIESLAQVVCNSLPPNRLKSGKWKNFWKSQEFILEQKWEPCLCGYGGNAVQALVQVGPG